MATSTRQFLGASDKDRVDQALLRPDTRRTTQKIFDALSNGKSLGLAFFATAAALLIFPALLIPALLFLLVGEVALYPKAKRETLPFRLPVMDGGPDYNDPIPGTKRSKYFKSSGIFHIGNDQVDGAQLWVNKRDALTHFMVFGGTGSGKTEVLVSLASNYLLLSSGIAYVDPKAAPKLAFQIYSMCRMLWRDHDYRLMNYMTSAKRDSSGYVHPRRSSNSANPFNKGSPEQSTSILGSLLAAAEGPNAVFANNAQNLIAGLMRGMAELRDEHRQEMYVRNIRDNIASAAYHKIATDDRLRQTTRDSMMAFLRSMGFVETQPYEKQSASFHQQYGYAQAYFSQPLNSLTDSYGYIFGRSPMGEVDFEDVIKQRRILLVMLPSLAKSPAELSNLGKVILGGIRNAVSVGLGDRIEGTVQGTMDASPMAAKYPFGTFIDEYAAIATEGFVQVLTQGRGLGISALIGTQDYAGLKHASEVEAQQAVENSTIKMFGKMDTGETTFELLKKIAGEFDVAANAGMEMRDGASAYFDQGRTSFSRVSRVELLDLQRQIEGEFHVYFRGVLVRSTVFYANPRLNKKDQLRINAMLPVPWPTEREANEAAGQFKRAVEAIQSWMNGGAQAQADQIDERFAPLAAILDDESMGARERGAVAVVAWSAAMDADAVGAGGTPPTKRGGGGGGNAMSESPEQADDKAPVAFHEQPAIQENVARTEQVNQKRGDQADRLSIDKGVGNALDLLDDDIVDDLLPAEKTEEAVAQAKETAALTEEIAKDATEGEIQYPVPPTPTVIRHDDAKKLIEELKERMMR